MLAIAGSTALVQLGLVLAVLIGALAVAGRRFGGPSAGAATRLLRLTPHDAVHVVEVDGRRLLIGTGPSGAPRLLCELDGADGADGAIGERHG